MNKKMQIVIFGSKFCGPCMNLKERLDKANIKYTYADITENLSNLKVFLKYRDTLDIFNEVKKEDLIGIPFVIINKDEKFLFDVTDEDIEIFKKNQE